MLFVALPLVVVGLIGVVVPGVPGAILIFSFLIGTVIKVGLAFAMLGIFLMAWVVA